MFSTLKTLMTGANARAEEKVRDVYALELIDQKIREAEHSLKMAKATLASLIQRQRAETRQVQALTSRIEQMTHRATEALEAGNEALATEAAQAIAQMENELTVRQETLDRLAQKVVRLQASLEAGHRRIVDLKQGAVTARAVRQEAQMQRKLNSTIGQTSHLEEAENLIARVVGQDDPFEQAEILKDIDAGLTHESLADKMAAQGFGPSTKTTGADVLARLKSNT